MTLQLNRSSQGRKCQQCGLPGVRVSTTSGSNDAGSRAYYKCVPCNRNLGPCPCTTPGTRTTLTCSCGDIDAELHGLGLTKQTSNPHNPDSGFDEDWESNCSPGFMVSKFKARGRELLHWA
ncbi:hypothetical protein N7491_000073 [Penicillium cf. griseofulvum]|uniref:GRF-like zinc ribbon domain-containing protein n=1 Tax=Penicillium cf. griseofulvum TaxID=2972120 RepID=A0A9W9JM08_9EURO|nr:hypothetical protein N7472_004574 [Penicillium cf. griseofulvum]KAJ5442136.1 hypothetical protein N7445_005143 [Penicillium cf. griseofulvum]KAJ5450891.1 hypothetical protein N7491_000073 [Penicillium cf. griseofulvum]